MTGWRIIAKMDAIRKQLGTAKSGGGDIPTPFRTKRTMSAAARKRIAAAQKKRWAEYRKQHRTAE